MVCGRKSQITNYFDMKLRNVNPNGKKYYNNPKNILCFYLIIQNQWNRALYIYFNHVTKIVMILSKMYKIELWTSKVNLGYTYF